MINKYVGLAENPALGPVPNFVKRPVLRLLQRSGHASATTIFTNLGQVTLPAALEGVITDLRFINGDTRFYGLVSTVSCVSCGNTLNLCWSQATENTRWMDACLAVLREDGVPAEKTE